MNSSSKVFMLGLFLISILVSIFYFFSDIFRPIIFGFLLAYFLDPITDKLENLKIPRFLGSLLLILLSFFILTVFTIFILPVFFRQFNQFIMVLPDLYEWVLNFIEINYEKNIDAIINALRVGEVKYTILNSDELMIYQKYFPEIKIAFQIKTDSPITWALPRDTGSGIKNKISELVSSGNNVKIYTIGKKGREQLSREFSSYFANHFDLSEVKSLSYEVALKISTDILAGFNNKEFDSVLLYFSRFQSVLVQNPTELKLIPASIEASEASEASYEYEPDQDEILEELLPQAITTQIFTALLENAASEQGARMSAMDNATRNAGDMIDKLTIQYNRSRQAAITNELIEIISGAEAL